MLPHPLRMKNKGVAKIATPSANPTDNLSYQRILSIFSHSTAADLSLCPPSEPPLIRTLPHPHSHPVLWTVDHLIALESILTDPVEKLSSGREPGLQVYKTLTGQHLFTDQKTLLHSQNFLLVFLNLASSYIM